jgi:hypothetical protein
LEIREALEELEEQGHAVVYKPIVSGDGRPVYHVDGIPRTEDQILRWVVDGVRPGN